MTKLNYENKIKEAKLYVDSYSKRVLEVQDQINRIDFANSMFDTWWKRFKKRKLIKHNNKIIEENESIITEYDDAIKKTNEEIVDLETKISEITVSLIELSPFKIGQEFFFIEEKDRRIRPVLLYKFDMDSNEEGNDILIYKVYDVQQSVLRTIYKSDLLLDKLSLISYIKSIENHTQEAIDSVEANDWASDPDRNGMTDEFKEKADMLDNWTDFSAVLDFDRENHYKERYDFSNFNENPEKVKKDWHVNRDGMDKFLNS